MRLDIVVVGATGFTGRLVVQYLAKESENVTWAITARSQTKLQELVEHLQDEDVDISHIPSFVVDVSDNQSLNNALAQAKIVLNCVGPYTEYSQPIVEACLETGTHYLDISAEIQHILHLYIKYHKAAEKANILIIPSCAFASMVAASGYIYLKDLFQGTLNDVEIYVTVGIPKLSYFPCTGALVSYGTWDSLVHVLCNLEEYQREKARVFPAIELPNAIKRNFFHCRQNSLWFPYPGPDEDVMLFSERYLYQKRKKNPTHFKVYTKMPLFVHYIIIPAMFLYFYLCNFKWFARLLRQYPRFFTLGYMSHAGPSEKKRNQTTYGFTFYGKGWDNSVDISKQPNKKMKVMVSSRDPYRSSAVMMVIGALTILKEQAQMPSSGVVNVGAAFYNTSIVERLGANGITFEVLRQE